MYKSKWMPLMSFECSGNSFIVLCRINKKNGMLYFKQKRINNPWTLSYKIPKIDIDEQFKKILNEING